jgi:hypothetical protein
LGEAALGKNALKHELSLLRRGGGEKRPNVGDALLIVLRQGVEFPLQLIH